MKQEKQKEKKQRVVRTAEERKELYRQKIANIETQEKNREVKTIWQSEFRKNKSMLNKDKSKNYIEKITAFRDWLDSVLQDSDKEYLDTIGAEQEENKNPAL